MARRSVNNPYKDVINMKKVPILPLDNRWHQLFPENEKPARIKKLEQEVMNLVKRESKANQELKALVKLKKKLMNEIVDNMEPADEKEEALRQKKLEKSQQLIIDINKKTNEVTDEKYNLPHAIIRANEELLMASIELCYDRISKNKEQIAILGEWIERTRNELKKNVVIKQEKEDINANIYTYMHDMLGPEFMEIFDKEYKV